MTKTLIPSKIWQHRLAGVGKEIFSQSALAPIKMKKMTTLKMITILLLIQIPILMAAQNDETFEAQPNRVGSNSTTEIQKFHTKFKLWKEEIGNDSTKTEMNEKGNEKIKADKKWPYVFKN